MFLWLPLLAGAQEHLTFLDIPIQGDLKVFVNNLKAKGFNPIRSYKYNGYTTKSVNGHFWEFPSCDVSVRCHNELGTVSSICLVPQCNNYLMWDMVNAFDRKYGEHLTDEQGHDICFTWTLTNGVIQIQGRTIYNQKFSVIYRDYTETNLLMDKYEKIDSDL